MTEEATSVPIPTTLRELILTSNQLLQNYQQELSAKVQVANREMMIMLGLNPQDGWLLDLNTMSYIKGQSTSEVTLEQEIEE